MALSDRASVSSLAGDKIECKHVVRENATKFFELAKVATPLTPCIERSSNFPPKLTG